MAVILRQSSATTVKTTRTFKANCLVTDEVGNMVRISGSSTASLYTVSSVDITSPDYMPAVGIIIEKPTTTTCVVQMYGPASVPGDVTNLEPGRRCFVGYDSKPTIIPPNVADSPTGKMMLQIVGVALDDDEMEIMPNMSIVQLRS